MYHYVTEVRQRFVSQVTKVICHKIAFVVLYLALWLVKHNKDNLRLQLRRGTVKLKPIMLLKLVCFFSSALGSSHLYLL